VNSVALGAVPGASQGQVVQGCPVGTTSDRQDGPTVVQATVVSTDGRTSSVPRGNIVQTAPMGIPMDTVVGQPAICVGFSGEAPRQQTFTRASGRMPDAFGEELYPAEDPWCLAVLSCCCCFWVTGVLAIIRAKEVSLANERGDYKLAHLKRQQAMRLIYLSVAIGINIHILYYFLRRAVP